MKMYPAQRNSNLLYTMKTLQQLENLARKDISSPKTSPQSRSTTINPRLIKRTQRTWHSPIPPNTRIMQHQLPWDSKTDATRVSVLTSIIKRQTTTKISWRLKKSQLHLFLLLREQRSPTLRLKRYSKKILHSLSYKTYKRKLYYKCIGNRRGSQRWRLMLSSWLFQLTSTRLFNLTPK